MGRAVWEGVTSDQRALLELVDRIGDGWRTREPGAEEAVAAARDALVGSGVWALGLPEAGGGGGADHATTQLAIARVATRWPALGLAMAHLHAAGIALAGDERLAEAVGGRPVAVVQTAEPPDGGLVVPRVDVGAARCDLVLVHGERCWLVPAERARFGEQSRHTGLDGALTRPVEVPTRAARELGAADAVRVALYAGALAVAAGLVHAAADHATDYAAERVQFGAPLTALATMRDTLATLRGRAVTLRATALAPPGAPHESASALREALDAAVDTASAALQCFGGYGYLEEYPVAGLFRDAVSLRAAAHVGVAAAV